MDKNKSVIDKLFDENNNDNIILYNAKDEPTEFEQAALIPIDGKAYALLSLAHPSDEISAEEGFVFAIETDKDGNDALRLITDEKIIDQVFEIYNGLLEELEGEDDESDEDEADADSDEDEDDDDIDLDDEPEEEDIDLEDDEDESSEG